MKIKIQNSKQNIDEEKKEREKMLSFSKAKKKKEVKLCKKMNKTVNKLAFEIKYLK